MKRRLRILLLNHNYRDRGTYFRLLGIGRQLVARGHSVRLLTVSMKHAYCPEWSTVDGVKIGEMPNIGQNNSGEGYGPLDNALRLMIATRYRFDVVHMFDHKPNASFPAVWSRLLGSKVVADWADWWGGPTGINDVKRRIPAVGKFEAWWEIESKRFADAVTVISKPLYERAVAAGVPESSIHYLPNGATTDRFWPMDKAEARRLLGIPQDRKLAGYIGISPSELDITLRSLTKLPDVWLLVIGPPSEWVRSTAESLGVSERVIQTGFIPNEDVHAYPAACDVMCLPLADRAANRGRLAGKILDYMTAGRPTLTTNVGDHARIISELDAGLVATTEDEYTAALDRLVSDRQLADRLGQNGTVAVNKFFAWPEMVARLELLYYAVLGDERASKEYALTYHGPDFLRYGG